MSRKSILRCNGTLLSQLKHHEYVVWTVKIWLNRIFTASYDCSIAYINFKMSNQNFEVVEIRQIHGPESWADAMGIDSSGQFMATHDGITTHQLDIWDLQSDHEKPFLSLNGHTDEVIN